MDIRDGIRAFAEGEPDIIAAYLFGSQAGGKAHRHSDVDVAVLLPTDLFPQTFHIESVSEF